MLLFKKAINTSDSVVFVFYNAIYSVLFYCNSIIFLLILIIYMLDMMFKYSLGATAAIITSMGIVAGLGQNDSLKMITIAGLLTFAIADNISDALAIHIYKESEGNNKKEVYRATFGNFITRFITVLSFIVIVWLLTAHIAIIVACLWGLALLTLISYKISKIKKSNPKKEIFWHLFVSVCVIVGSTLIGNLFIR
ncbi:hypothetical protein EBQ91_03155 [bacterium]|nr:hypothetical protein [bacterium]